MVSLNMRFGGFVTALVMYGAPTALAQPIVPANDLCSGALPLTLNAPVYGDNAAATSFNDGPAAPCYPFSTSRAVWFRFTPATTQRYQVSACHTRYNSVLTVFNAVDCTTFADSAFVVAPGGCNNDECGGDFNFPAGTANTGGPGPGGLGNVWAPLISSMPLTAGVTYYIRLSGEDPMVSTGQYQMAVYDFVGYGACCSGAGACSLVLAQQCDTTHTSLFLGAGTVCAPNPCTGACCNDTTFACTVTTPDTAACIAGNTWQGFRTTCAVGPCVTGSCCSAAGACTTTTFGQCAAGTPTSMASAWRAGVACGSCLPLGACCDKATFACTLFASGTSCPVGTAFAGYGTTCAANPCPTGVCCSAFLACAVTLASECNNNTIANHDQTSKWYPGIAACTPANPCTTACCNSTSFACSVVTPTTVTGANCPSGSFSLGVGSACGAGVCDSGACCSPTGDCLLVAGPLCNRTSHFAGVGTACSPTSACTAACCNNATGTCSIVSLPAPSTCTSQGIFSVCSPNPCPALGACCAADHTCTFVVSALCTDTFQGPGSVCSPNPCSGGACCNNASATCTFTASSAACTGGTFHGLGSACDPSPCPSGACCNASSTTGPCSVTGPSGCTGGTFLGIGTACSPEPCPGGACCSSTSTVCVFTGVGGCPSPGAFHGLGSSCTPNPCAGACCSASTGVCALASSVVSCQVSADLSFQGLGSVCLPNPCPQPPPPANDLCSTAQSLTLNVPFAGDNTFATGDGTEGPGGYCYTDGSTHFQKGVWFSFTAPATASYMVSSCGTVFDTVLSVFSVFGAPACDSLAEIACNDDSCNGTTDDPSPGPGPGSGLASVISRVVLTAGDVYYIRLASWDAAGGRYGVLVRYSADITIGACCDASSCTLTDEFSCNLAFTPGATCSPGPCASSGVCCRGATCNASVAQASCTGSGAAGAYYATSSGLCNSGGSTNSPCCYADFNKVGGITVQDIFDYLNAWFGGSQFAITGGDGVSGSLAVQNIFEFLNAWFIGGCG
jgi:hypothetical protein